MRILKGLWHDEDGLTSVEYALLLIVLIFGASTIWVSIREPVGTQVDLAGTEVE